MTAAAPQRDPTQQHRDQHQQHQPRPVRPQQPQTNVICLPFWPRMLGCAGPGPKTPTNWRGFSGTGGFTPDRCRWPRLRSGPADQVGGGDQLGERLRELLACSTVIGSSAFNSYTATSRDTLANPVLWKVWCIYHGVRQIGPPRCQGGRRAGVGLGSSTTGSFPAGYCRHPGPRIAAPQPTCTKNT
jgi:hypothetical protein